MPILGSCPTVGQVEKRDGRGFVELFDISHGGKFPYCGSLSFVPQFGERNSKQTLTGAFALFFDPWGGLRFFLPGGTYFKDDMTTTSEKITLQVAAKALDVSVRTVQRYIDKGLITKVKEDGKVYVIVDEIRGLRKKLEATNDTTGDRAKIDKTTITVDMSYLEGLLVQIGEMKEKQRLLLEYKDDIRQREVSLLAKEQELTQTKAALAANSAELDQAKAAITKARSELQRLLEIKQDAEQKAKVVLNQQEALEAKERELAEIREEVERFRLPWWKRLFRK
jgi:hypothetical protein